MEEDNHCKDCCCAQSWKSLGVTKYTGKSIPEHIEELLTERDRYKMALDQISKVPDDYPLSAVKRKATASVGYYGKDNKGRKRDVRASTR